MKTFNDLTKDVSWYPKGISSLHCDDDIAYVAAAKDKSFRVEVCQIADNCFKIVKKCDDMVVGSYEVEGAYFAQVKQQADAIVAQKDLSYEADKEKEAK